MKYKNYNNYDKCRQWHKFHTHQKIIRTMSNDFASS